MKEFYFQLLNFILNYWYIFLSAFELLSLIVYFVFSLIIKKKNKPIKVVDTLKETILRVLPALINQAEYIFSSNPSIKFDGHEKLMYVLESLAKVLKELGYGDDVMIQYLPFAKEQVELILSTPQKKEALKNEKRK